MSKTHVPVGTDEARETDDASVGKQLGHLGDASDVLEPVLGREAEVLVQSVPDVVSVEAVRGDASPHQVLLQRERYRRLARTGQT